MLDFSVLQNQWLILALFGGVAGALVVVLAYLALWRSGGSPGETPPDVPVEETHERGRVPWVLIFIWAAAIVYSVGYVFMKALHPPTW
jgi:hypothetical protein